MPSEASAVGAIELPVASGAVGSKIEDPVVGAILDFASFYIKDVLDAKLQNILPAGTIVDAVPAANRFDFGPLEPRGLQITLPVPALFVWWDGDSRVMEMTLHYSYRVRVLEILYVFPELPKTAEMERRIGLVSTVDAALHKMSFRRFNDAYAYGTSPAGMGISQALAPVDVIDWEYNGGSPGRFGIDEAPGVERRAKRSSGRDYPALMGSFTVYERVQQKTLEDPGDVLHDSLMAIYGAGEGTETMLILDGTLTSPDGTEED